MCKRYGLFQIAQMTGLFDDLKLTILGGSHQCGFPFPILLVVFPIDNECWAWEAPQHVGQRVNEDEEKQGGKGNVDHVSNGCQK